ncbi:MAG: tRNA1(Val) A37 N6-methylase TrmN6, partial [Paracoccaceae bacterium]
SFDHVIVNPPYFLRTAGSSAPDAAREAAMGEDTPLQSWTDAARRRLRPKGWLTLIQRPERLSDVLAALGSGFGDLRLLPIMPRAGRDASLFLLRARKGSRAPLRILSPVVMHSGAVHDQERQDYSAEIERVLRHPCAFPGFGDGGFVEH